MKQKNKFFIILFLFIGVLFYYLLLDQRPLDFETDHKIQDLSRKNRPSIPESRHNVRHNVRRSVSSLKDINRKKTPLWSPLKKGHELVYKDPDVSVKFIKMNMNRLNTLQVGQEILFPLLKEKIISGTVTSKKDGFQGTTVFKGNLETGKKFASFNIVKGATKTVIMMATGSKFIQIEVQNATGVGSLLDDDELDQYRGEKH